MGDELVLGAVDIKVRSERLDIILILGSSIDGGSANTVVWFATLVSFDEVLHHLGPNALEEEAKMTKQRVVSKNAVMLLGQIPDPHAGCRY